MKFSKNWLKQWVDISCQTTNSLVDQLTMLGLEVDACSPVAPPFTQVLIGEIMEAVQHPNADRLKVCRVDVGRPELSIIVCGAPNARAGIKVPIALPGAELPNHVKIKRAQLRGVESEGMICAARELGLVEEDAVGIMELPLDAPVGLNFRDYLELDDEIIEVSITPNRGDCLSIKGIAREVAVANQIPMDEPSASPIQPAIPDTFPIRVEAPQDCPYYAGRVIKHINPDAQTPIWMKERLKRSDVRCIHPAVDVANYVMLELGQPMHAFDLDLLKGSIVVRQSEVGEDVVLIDGKTVDLRVGTLVISDEEKIQAIAGVKGGAFSMVSQKTNHLFLESAHFTPLSIRRSVQTYAIRTDASQRFERGVDGQLPFAALDRATQLILSFMGGEAGPIQAVESAEYLPSIPAILLRRHQIARILGFLIDDEKICHLLAGLGMKFKPLAQGWEVIPPSYRFDIRIEADLIEELARLYGYDQIPMEKTISYSPVGFEATRRVDLNKIREIMTGLSYHETISYSFISPDYHAHFASCGKAIMLSNPISQDLSVMRPTLWAGLVKSFLYNHHRQQERIRLFEIGVCFLEENGVLLQKEKIAGLVSGFWVPEQWSEKTRPVDFYDVKGDLENLFSALGCPSPEFIQENLLQPLHPGQAACMVLNNQLLGHVGALHPQLKNDLKVSVPLYLFEIDLPVVGANLLKKTFEPYSKFPAIRRDISLVVDKNLSWHALKEKINTFSNKHLNMVKLFDIYLGKPIQAEKKSVSVSLTFQSKTETLLETEVNQKMEELLKFLEKTVNATLRD